MDDDRQLGNDDCQAETLPVANLGAAAPRQAAKLNSLQLQPLSNFVPQAQRWLWDAMIPQGALTLVAGTGGSHKSTLLAHLAAGVTQGTLPGDANGRPMSVAYLTRENDNARSMMPKMVAAGADVARTFVLGGRDVRLPYDLDRLLAFCVTEDVGLVVLDPMLAFLSNARSMQGNYGTSVAALTDMTEACAERGISLVGVAHLVKGSKKASADTMIGSVGLTSTARQVIMVGKSDESMLAGVVKSNVGPTGNGWVFSVRYEPIGRDMNLGGRIIDAPFVELVRPALEGEVQAMLEAQDEENVDSRTHGLVAYVLEMEPVDSRQVSEFLQREFHIRDRSARSIIGKAVSTGLITRVAEGQGADLRFLLSVTEAGYQLVGERTAEAKHAVADPAGFEGF